MGQPLSLSPHIHIRASKTAGGEPRTAGEKNERGGEANKAFHETIGSSFLSTTVLSNRDELNSHSSISNQHDH